MCSFTVFNLFSDVDIKKDLMPKIGF
jgi:hypothetical protein